MPYPDINKENFKIGLLTDLCNNLKEAVAVVKGQEGKIVFFNSVLLELFELNTAGEIYPAQLNRLRKIELSKEEIKELYQVAEEKGTFTEEVEYQSETGKCFWGDLSITALRSAPGYYLVIVNPIDRIKEKERKLLNDLQRFNALFENASLGIIETNHHGEIVNVNPFILELFGYEKDDLINKKIEMLIPARFHSRHLKHRQDYMQSYRTRPVGVGMDLFAVKKDGTEFPVEVSLTSYHRNDEKCVIAFVSDISLRKESELKIKKLNEGLEEMVAKRTRQLQVAIEELEISKEKLARMLEREKELGELKSRFVSMASHEFRTPLSTVLSSAYLLEKYTTTEEQAKRQKHLHRIVSSVTMLTDILNDFLSVGKIEEGKINVRFEVFNIRNLIISIAEEIKNNLKKGQKILFDHKGHDTVFLDPSLLKHMVMNLVSNASKFSPESSVIEIKTINRDERLLLAVKDYGIGISKQDQEHLMERFFRAANAANIQGTGLGLHIVSKYAELMSGVMEYESELGKGTEFKITFNKTNQDEKDTAD